MSILLLIAGVAQAQTDARIRDFQAPAVDNAGRKSLIKGKDAVHVGNRIYQITAPHLDTFRTDGSPDMTIDATECLFDSGGAKDVWSDKELSMRTADDRLTLKGVGFRWKPAESQLVVSNNVEAIIRRQALVSASLTNKDFIRVTANSMERQINSVIFRGSVHVVDPQGEVRCHLLKVRFDEKNALQEIEALEDVILTQGQTEARGNRALYAPNSGLLRLFEKTKWRMGDREGESELLILHRTNNTLRAETKVRMTLPSSLLATNAVGQATITNAVNTNRVTITADSFDYAPTNIVTQAPIAIFNGSVHAVDPQATLDCELLTIFFDRTNRLVRAIAERNVEITRPDGAIKGARAVFEKDEITINAQPTWRLKESAGSAELLVINPRTREVRALQKVRMEIPTTGTNFIFTTAPTNRLRTTNIMVVTANYFTNRENIATFSDNVRVSEPRGQIDANRMSLQFGASNRVERITADGDVILTEQKAQAIGQRADYDVLNEQIRLTGMPKVMAEGREIIAREFLIDRPKNTFQPVAPFRIELRRQATNSP